jgi:hypothetical protein
MQKPQIRHRRGRRWETVSEAASSLLAAFEESQGEVLPSSALFVRREPVVKPFDLDKVEPSVSVAQRSDSCLTGVSETKRAHSDDHIVTALMAAALFALFFSFFLL